MKRHDPDDDLPEEPLINLTPLIDVVFVVLIAFMLIAPVLEIDKVDLAVSGTEKKKKPRPPNNHRSRSLSEPTIPCGCKAAKSRSTNLSGY